MRLPDSVTGSFLVALGAAAAYGGWILPPVPGQPVGPNVFPLVIGTGLALCGLAIVFGVGHSFEEEEELIPVEGDQPKPAPPVQSLQSSCHRSVPQHSRARHSISSAASTARSGAGQAVFNRFE